MFRIIRAMYCRYHIIIFNDGETIYSCRDKSRKKTRLLLLFLKHKLDDNAI